MTTIKPSIHSPLYRYLLSLIMSGKSLSREDIRLAHLPIDDERSIIAIALIQGVLEDDE